MKTLLTLALLLLAFSVSANAAPYPEITLDQLKAAMADKTVILLDANGTNTWKQGHIPGALNFAASKDNLSSVLPKDKDTLIVAYCMCVGCPYYLDAAKAAQKLGYTNIKHFAPGIYGWRESHSPVEKAK